MTTILCISGSLRTTSSATAFLEALIAKLEGEVRFVRTDIGALPHYNADLEPPDEVEAFKKAVDDADGLLVVTPEYNYSIPGVLKNAIDWASRPAYRSVFKDKAVLPISVSGGALGGVRAQAHLKYIMNGMLARIHPAQEIVVPFAPKKVEDGVFKDEATLDFAADVMRGFLEALKVST